MGFLANKTKCTKKYPQTCRIHGDAYRKELNFFRETRVKALKQEFNKLAVKDFANSWKLVTKNGKTFVNVYRSGIVANPDERGVESHSYAQADQFCPPDRQGRMTGIFASPTLGGVGRWVLGNALIRSNALQVNSLRVNIDTTYVYSIKKWD